MTLQENETDNLREEFAKEIGDLAQGLINIQNLLKHAPQSAWVDSVLDICRETLAGSLAPGNESLTNNPYILTGEELKRAEDGRKKS